jgi:hypothetical protein
MTSLSCPGIGTFPAFPGQKESCNNPEKTNVPDIGPIVRGRYFIVERPSGGRLGPFRERLLKDIYGTDRSTWFGLFRDDEKLMTTRLYKASGGVISVCTLLGH